MLYMHKQFAKRIFFLIITLTFLVSCSDQPTILPSDATLVDNVYKNNFFSFQIKLPDGWYSASEETMNAIAKTGQDVLAGDDKNLNASIEAAQKNVYNLFQTFQVAPGTPIEFFNSNMSCFAEKVSHLPGIKTGEDYLLNVKQLLKSGQVDIIFSDEIKNINFGGTDFYSLKGAISIMGYEIKQVYYATFLNGFVLGFVVNYLENEQQTTIQESINSIYFY